MTSDLLDILNPQQREAVTAGDGPTLVLAGPGSGKTRVLTHRIAYLVQDMGVYASNIVSVTFTNKAAAEMRERVETILGGRLDGLQIGTFHAICARLLRFEADHTPYGRDYVIYDSDDQSGVVKGILTELNVDLKRFKPGAVLGAISSAKNELIGPTEFMAADYFGEIVARVYPRYQNALLASNAMDFDDLLMQTVLLMRDNATVREKYQSRWRYVLVDEFQDTNTAQFELVRQFSNPQRNVFVVGDEDQGIYAFRGADYRNVMTFRREYPTAKVILLEQNYRSTQNVLDVARAVIDKNGNRTPKKLFTEHGAGAKVMIQEVYSESEEAQFVVETIRQLIRTEDRTFRDFAIMYRTNAQSRSLEEACVKFNMPYKLIGGVGFYKRREIRDIVAYLRVINNPNDAVSFDRIVNTPARGIGEKTIATLRAWCAAQSWTIAEALDALVRGVPSPLTGRAAKGLAEFARLVTHLQAFAELNTLDLLFDEIIKQVNYYRHAQEISETDEQHEERMENLAALRGIMSEKKDLALRDFLEETALVAEIDSLDTTKNGITLLTLHAAKGLEYPVVFITGVEDGLLPHSRSIGEVEPMAEERRLLYVGITRARERLYLTYAFRRSLYGESSEVTPSRFLVDIPPALTTGEWFRINTMRERAAVKQATTWDRPKAAATPPYAPTVVSFQQGVDKLIANKRAGVTVPVAGVTLPAAGLRFTTGTKVQHAKFGEGVVVSSKKVGDDEEVEIDFSVAGRRVLSANFAKLVITGK